MKQKLIPEVNGSISNEFNVDLGCIQGSVLGPKLFNLCTRSIPSILPHDTFITTYADDSYVIISSPTGNPSEKVKKLLTWSRIFSTSRWKILSSGFFHREKSTCFMTINFFWKLCFSIYMSIILTILKSIIYLSTKCLRYSWIINWTRWLLYCLNHWYLCPDHWHIDV